MSNKLNVLKQVNFAHLAFFIFAVATGLFLYKTLVYGDMVITQEQYLHLNIARTLMHEGFVGEMQFTSCPFPYIFTIFDALLMALGVIMPLHHGMLLLGLLLSALSALLFYKVLRRLKIKLEVAVLATIIYLLSPLFTVSVTGATPGLLGMTLSLGAFLFITSQRAWPIGVFLLVLLPLTGFYHGLMTLVALFFYLYANPSFRPRFIAASIIISVLTIVFYAPVYLEHGQVEMSAPSDNAKRFFATDLGATEGYSIFTMLLGLAGLYMAWRNKTVPKLLIASFAVLVVISFASLSLDLYVNIVLSLLAGAVISRLLARRWGLEEVRSISLLLIFCGILFSSISFTTDYISSGPSKELISSVERVSGTTALSHPSYGQWITYYTGMSTVWDSYCDENERASYENLTTTLFMQRNLVRTLSLLENNSIDTIIITKEMKRGLVFEEPDQGILFLLSNNETFHKIEEEGVEIWQVLPTASN